MLPRRCSIVAHAQAPYVTDGCAQSPAALRPISSRVLGVAAERLLLMTTRPDLAWDGQTGRDGRVGLGCRGVDGMRSSILRRQTERHCRRRDQRAG